MIASHGWHPRIIKMHHGLWLPLLWKHYQSFSYNNQTTTWIIKFYCHVIFMLYNFKLLKMIISIGICLLPLAFNDVWKDDCFYYFTFRDTVLYNRNWTRFMTFVRKKYTCQHFFKKAIAHSKNVTCDFLVMIYFNLWFAFNNEINLSGRFIFFKETHLIWHNAADELGRAYYFIIVRMVQTHITWHQNSISVRYICYRFHISSQ